LGERCKKQSKREATDPGGEKRGRTSPNKSKVGLVVKQQKLATK